MLNLLRDVQPDGPVGQQARRLVSGCATAEAAQAPNAGQRSAQAAADMLSSQELQVLRLLTAG